VFYGLDAVVAVAADRKRKTGYRESRYYLIRKPELEDGVFPVLSNQYRISLSDVISL